MDTAEFNRIKEMMENVHRNYFPKVVELKNSFPFDLLEDDLIVRFANIKKQIEEENK